MKHPEGTSLTTDIGTIYIGHEWVTPSTTNKIEIQSPATGEPNPFPAAGRA